MHAVPSISFRPYNFHCKVWFVPHFAGAVFRSSFKAQVDGVMCSHVIILTQHCLITKLQHHMTKYLSAIWKPGPVCVT